MDVILQIFTLTILWSTIRQATPLILASLGGIFAERSGVINIALEGIMLTGAFASIYGMHLTGSPWIGLLFAIIVGILIACIHAVVTVIFKTNQVVSGTAINIFASGLTVFLLEIIWKVSGTSPRIGRLPTWTVGPLSFNPIVYIAFIMVPVVWFILYRTPWGLRIRAVGEHPQAADTVGINVNRIRFICVLISGAFAGLAGAHLSIGELGIFQKEMTAGRGFIALAAMIFGKWNPIGAFLASLLFAFAQAVSISGVQIPFIPRELINTIPYVITIIVLASFVGRAHAPKAIGKPYDKSER
ncbi:nucleoside ABC transporter membrane protein [Anaerobranca californiensis DSM 14826]|uniref:Nucleoside ABC transporter membrane protein n=1 Tax=Anaerobranca californiensis DSM 14826 TaxID=1120989 RepID=A0A1M6KC25_9FIRM|nr:ABC transporter permease [Anaerobranca californiensis]SHJ56525.1 nucleoside ABC transporter membrane protein [Anaerobranca californiensis DSM 14826]